MVSILVTIDVWGWRWLPGKAASPWPESTALLDVECDAGLRARRDALEHHQQLGLKAAQGADLDYPSSDD